MRIVRLLALLTVLLAALLTVPATASATTVTTPPQLGGGSVLMDVGSTARCTTAFVATAGYLITGPGCEGVGTDLFTDGVLVGPIVASPFPSGGYSVVEVSNPAAWTLVPWVGGAVVLRGSQEAPVGASVCLLGPATGGVHCGNITAKDVTVNFPSGTISGLTQTTVCFDPGFGGGAFISGEQAQGVFVGGSGSCATGGTSFFAPINPILSAYGLTLLTG